MPKIMLLAYEINSDELRYIQVKAMLPDISGAKLLFCTESSDVYARWFEKGNHNWVNEPEYNRIFLRTHQNWANDLLKARGHLFLNEVYSQLGIRHSALGSLAGWIYDSSTSVDYGCWDQEGKLTKSDDGKNAVLLDFNAGVIWDKLA